MLTIKLSDRECFNAETNEFITIKGKTIQFEHSLVSISKWESKWKKPFLSDKQPTREEFMDYIKCMTITQGIDDLTYLCLSNKDIEEIRNYINDPMTATTINRKDQKKGSKEIITSELIYYWMISLNIPFECQKWHLNRLLMLIDVCGIKNEPAKKMKPKETLSQYKALNAKRKAAMHTKG